MRNRLRLEVRILTHFRCAAVCAGFFVYTDCRFLNPFFLIFRYAPEPSDFTALPFLTFFSMAETISAPLSTHTLYVPTELALAIAQYPRCFFPTGGKCSTLRFFLCHGHRNRIYDHG